MNDSTSQELTSLQQIRILHYIMSISLLVSIFLLLSLVPESTSKSFHVGAMHNIAMIDFETSVERHNPEDTTEYLQLVVDQAIFLCNGVDICRHSIDNLVEQALLYAQEAGDEMPHIFNNRTVDRFQDILPTDLRETTRQYVTATVDNVLSTHGHNETSITLFSTNVIDFSLGTQAHLSEYRTTLGEDCDSKRAYIDTLLAELDLIIAHASTADKGAGYWHPTLHDVSNPLLKHAAKLLEPIMASAPDEDYDYHKDDDYDDDYEPTIDDYHFLYEAQHRVKKCLKFKDLILAPMYGSVYGFNLPGPTSHNILISSVGSYIFSSVWFIIKMKNCAGVFAEEDDTNYLR